jgi:hypothetical protein
MATRDHFRALMRERRAFAPGSVDHTYRSRAARRLVWIIRKVPAACWPQ